MSHARFRSRSATGENTLDLTLREANLSIDEVVVTAQTRTETSGSSQVIDRRTIEHAQLININEIGSLLPGGKTAGDQNLTSGSQPHRPACGRRE